MARKPDGRRRKRAPRVTLAGLKTAGITAESAENVPSITKEYSSMEKTESRFRESNVELDKVSPHEESGEKAKNTCFVIQRIKQTEQHVEKSKEVVKKLSRDLDEDEACSLQLAKLKKVVERLGGKLEDGWYVNWQKRSNNGLPFFIFMSPTKERFRSRVEVARHLGLYANSTKSSSLGRTRSLSNSRLALVPYVRIKQKRRGTSQKPVMKRSKANGRKGKPRKALKAVADVKDMQITSTSSTSSSFISQQCQDVLRSIIATENFAALSNMLNRSTPASSLEATLPSVITGSLDLKLIYLRLSSGAYGQNPELFSADIQQVWKNIITAGNELVLLAQSLSELSENLYKHQIRSLFDVPSKEKIFGDTGTHTGPLAERIIARSDDGEFSKEITALDCLAMSAGSRHKSLSETHRAIRAKLQRNYMSKKVTTRAKHQLSKRVQKKTVPAQTSYALKERLISNATESFCQKCGLQLGVECVACRQCQASYHTLCIVSNAAATGWCCPMCLSNQLAENSWQQGVGEELRKELCLVNGSATLETASRELEVSTGKTGVCEVCKKEDDNVLLCDGCDAAYHMGCLSPSMDSVPDGYWYCPACDEAGKKTIVSHQDAHAHNCVVCERVSRELSLCAENESTAQVFLKENSSAFLAPERSRDNGYVEQSLNQGALEPPRVENTFVEAENACKVCGVDEGKKSVVCSNCRKCYHMSCLRPALRKRPRRTWFCPSCLCRACKTDADDDKIMLCDACDEAYHTYCLEPPISAIPEGAWYCPSCAKDQVLVHNLPSKMEPPKKKRKSTEPKKST